MTRLRGAIRRSRAGGFAFSLAFGFVGGLGGGGKPSVQEFSDTGLRWHGRLSDLELSRFSGLLTGCIMVRDLSFLSSGVHVKMYNNLSEFTCCDTPNSRAIISNSRESCIELCSRRVAIAMECQSKNLVQSYNL